VSGRRPTVVGAKSRDPAGDPAGVGTPCVWREEAIRELRADLAALNARPDCEADRRGQVRDGDGDVIEHHAEITIAGISRSRGGEALPERARYRHGAGYEPATTSANAMRLHQIHWAA
jgi:hypothetical protein